MNSDLGSPSADSEHQVSARIDRRKVGEPDVLKHAEHAELALLIDQGVVGDNREIEVQGSGDSDRGNDVVLFDLVDDIHAFGHLAEDGMYFVEMRLRCVGDEELAAPGVLAGVGHGERSDRMLVGVEVGLALDLITRASGPHPRVIGILGQGIAPLDHEVGDDPMKSGAIVELTVRQLLEILHRVGDFLVEQFRNDGAFAGSDSGRFGHVITLKKFGCRNVTKDAPLGGNQRSQRLECCLPGLEVHCRLATAGPGAGVASRCRAGRNHSLERRR